jgi:hypothetical protein
MGPVSAPPVPPLELVEPLVLPLLVLVLTALPPVFPLELLLPLEALLVLGVVEPLELLVPAPAPFGELLLPHAAIVATRKAGEATTKSEWRVKEG